MPDDYLKEITYDTTTLETFVLQTEPKLTEEQNKFYLKIMDSVNTKVGGIYFIDAPGGTGKTFVLNLIIASIRAKKKNCNSCSKFWNSCHSFT